MSDPPAPSEDYDPLDLAGTGHHLTPAELRTWTRFLDAGRLLEEILARHLSRDHAMNHSDYEVLVRLDGAQGRMRMATLARQVVSSSQKLTKTADRLEQRGWIERVPVASDARGLEAVLLPPGRDALASASGEHAQLIRRFLLDLLTPAEQATMADSMDRVADHLRLHREGRPCRRCNPSAPAPLAPRRLPGHDAEHGLRD